MERGNPDSKRFKPLTGQEVFHSLGLTTQTYLTDTPESLVFSFCTLVTLMYHICHDCYRLDFQKLVGWPPKPKKQFVFDLYRDALRQCNEEDSIAPFFTFCKSRLTSLLLKFRLTKSCRPSDRHWYRPSITMEWPSWNLEMSGHVRSQTRSGGCLLPWLRPQNNNLIC